MDDFERVKHSGGMSPSEMFEGKEIKFLEHEAVYILSYGLADQPASEVHVAIELGEVAIVVRIKSPEAMDRLLHQLRWYRDDVWGSEGAGEEDDGNGR